LRFCILCFQYVDGFGIPVTSCLSTVRRQVPFPGRDAEGAAAPPIALAQSASSNASKLAHRRLIVK
jgi:hypothetical protein